MNGTYRYTSVSYDKCNLVLHCLSYWVSYHNIARKHISDCILDGLLKNNVNILYNLSYLHIVLISEYVNSVSFLGFRRHSKAALSKLKHV